MFAKFCVRNFHIFLHTKIIIQWKKVSYVSLFIVFCSVIFPVYMYNHNPVSTLHHACIIIIMMVSNDIILMALPYCSF